ncbi:hypothetical protein T492DRAFT_991864 [Pavlovales sp. CCMP2436]|nr:hypothetical protein T492DRAFT_991864 [Pavlovales sp. CCMP2436]
MTAKGEVIVNHGHEHEVHEQVVDEQVVKKVHEQVVHEQVVDEHQVVEQAVDEVHQQVERQVEDEQQVVEQQLLLGQSAGSYRWSTELRARSLLESAFTSDAYPRMDQRLHLAAGLGVTQRQVQIWFQNRRQRKQHQRSARTSERRQPVKASFTVAELGLRAYRMSPTQPTPRGAAFGTAVVTGVPAGGWPTRTTISTSVRAQAFEQGYAQGLAAHLPLHAYGAPTQPQQQPWYGEPQHFRAYDGKEPALIPSPLQQLQHYLLPASTSPTAQPLPLPVQHLGRYQPSPVGVPQYQIPQESRMPTPPYAAHQLPHYEQYANHLTPSIQFPVSFGS